MVIMFVVISVIILVIAGGPLATYIGAMTNMIVVNGSPSSNQLSYDDNIQPIVNTGNQEQSEVLDPKENEQYGVITCEQIKLSAPLYYGDKESVLQRGAGQYAKSGLPGEGTPILVGGHDSTFFAPLEDIKVNDIVEIHVTGGTYKYQVNDIKILDKDDTTAFDLEEKKERLILYTCYPFGQLLGDREKRYYVYCDLIDHDTEQNE